jgi:hypothetical protein
VQIGHDRVYAPYGNATGSLALAAMAAERGDTETAATLTAAAEQGR